MRSVTVRKMLSQARSLLDESNEVNLDDDIDLLPSLNRGLDDAMDILSRRYPSAIIEPEDITPTNGDDTYDIPEDAFEDRLQKVEVEINGTYTPLTRIDYQDITDYETTGSGIPLVYVVIGQEFRILPAPSGITNIRVWYVKERGPLVPEYGRITSINTAQNYVQVTDVEDTTQVSSDISSLESYVNIVSGRTGAIRATLQIGSVTNGRVQFRSTPTRSTVQGRSVSGSIPSTVAEDDYLCPVDGSCIPVLRGSLVNFLVSYVVADIKAVKLDEDPKVVMDILNKFENRVGSIWGRREQSLRVSKGSRVWGPRSRSFSSRIR